MKDQTEPAVWQAKDGTVYKRDGDDWVYLSPLFGEWLRCFAPDLRKLQSYPRNINVPSAHLAEV